MAAVASAAATFVSAAVTSLRASAAGVSVSVTAVEPDRGIGLLLAGDVDVAVVDEYDHVPLALPEWAGVRPLCTERLVLVHAPAAGPERPALASVAGADWVLPPAPGPLTGVFERPA